MRVGTPLLLASPCYPPGLQVARGVSPALPHGRVGSPSSTRPLALPLPRVLLTVLGVPLPEGWRVVTGERGPPLAFPRELVGGGARNPLLTCPLRPTGTEDGPQGNDPAVGRHPGRSTVGGAGRWPVVVFGGGHYRGANAAGVSGLGAWVRTGDFGYQGEQIVLSGRGGRGLALGVAVGVWLVLLLGHGCIWASCHF